MSLEKDTIQLRVKLRHSVDKSDTITELNPMSSRIWNSLTDYQFLADQWKEEKDQEDKEVRQILKIPAFKFWSMIFVALPIPGLLLIILPILQRSGII